jgi:hypothetical protein
MENRPTFVSMLGEVVMMGLRRDCNSTHTLGNSWTRGISSCVTGLVAAIEDVYKKE